MGEAVRITDVSPRDGLQNEPAVVSTADKVRLVEALCAAGVDEIEVSSFVSPRWVPQLADAAEVFAALRRSKPPHVRFSALVPNEKGMAAALRVNDDAGERLIDKIAVFTAASETFSRRNTNARIAEAIARFRPVVELARSNGLATRGYVSCIVECPFEGLVEPGAVAEAALRLCDLGIDEIDLGETIGVATRESIRAVLEVVIERLADWLRPPAHASPGPAPSRHLRAPDGATSASRSGVEKLSQNPGKTGQRPVPQESRDSFERHDAGLGTRLTLHLHDTAGRAADCVRAALALGLRSFDGAVGGLGGCPYASTPARRAPGNIATELLVHTVRAAGFATRTDDARLVDAARLAARLRGGALADPRSPV